MEGYSEERVRLRVVRECAAQPTEGIRVQHLGSMEVRSVQGLRLHQAHPAEGRAQRSYGSETCDPFLANTFLLERKQQRSGRKQSVALHCLWS